MLTPPPIHPVIRGTCALCGVHEVYAMGGAHGDRGARLRDRDDRARRRHRRARQPHRAGGQAPGERQRRDRRVLRAERRARDRRRLRRRRASSRSTCSRRASTAPGAPMVAVSDAEAFLDALAAQLEALAPERPASDPAAFVLARADSLRDALAFAEAFAPEHLELAGPEARAARAPRALRRLRLRRRVRRDGVRRLRRGFEPLAADGRLGALRVGPVGAPLPPALQRGAHRRGRAGARRGGRADRPRGGLRRARRVDGSARRGESSTS